MWRALPPRRLLPGLWAPGAVRCPLSPGWGDRPGRALGVMAPGSQGAGRAAMLPRLLQRGPGGLGLQSTAGGFPFG